MGDEMMDTFLIPGFTTLMEGELLSNPSFFAPGYPCMILL
jgi:hypothetical protein